MLVLDKTQSWRMLVERTSATDRVLVTIPPMRSWVRGVLHDKSDLLRPLFKPCFLPHALLEELLASRHAFGRVMASQKCCL